MILSLILHASVVFTVSGNGTLLSTRFLRLYTRSEKEYKQLKDIIKLHDRNGSIEMLEYSRGMHQLWLDVICAEDEVSLFEGFGPVDMTSEVMRQIEATRPVPSKQVARANPFDLNDFNSYDIIMGQLERWRSMCPKGFYCEVKVLGQTHEGREIKSFSISKVSENNQKENSSNGIRSTIWMNSGIHAREWLSPATLLQIMDEFLNGKTLAGRNILSKYNLYFVPVVNPDGYAYTWLNQPRARIWRKNRSPTTKTGCVGTDLNRNYNYKWGLAGQEGNDENRCFDTFIGESAESELETKAITNEIQRFKTHSSPISLFFDIHSFGRMVLYPFGHKDPQTGQCARSVRQSDFERAGLAFARAATGKTNQGVPWISNAACDLYSASGLLSDYAHVKGEISYAYAIELSPGFISYDYLGFMPEKATIRISRREFWAGLNAMIQEIDDIRSAGPGVRFYSQVMSFTSIFTLVRLVAVWTLTT